MTAIQSTASTLLVAIGFSKNLLEVLIDITGKNRRRCLTIMNTLEDFERLSEVLSHYGLAIRIGFEATGNYHRTLVHHLAQLGAI